MEPRCKVIATEEEFLRLIPFVKTFPIIHNKLKDDFILLLKITEDHKDQTDKFYTLSRLCIKNLFALVEADIHYYNVFDMYEGYNDRDDFIKRFKETFKQISKHGLLNICKLNILIRKCNVWRSSKLNEML